MRRHRVEGVETPSIPRGRAIALTVEGVYVLLAAVDETRWGSFLRVALRCGARPGELLALRWPDVDFENATVIIARSLSETRADIADKATKTDWIRIVALPELAMDAFRRQRRLQAAERLAAGAAFVDNGQAFQRPLGGHLTPLSATEAFRVLARRLGIATTKLHALRHTTGSWLIASGVDARTTASVLGHSSPTVTRSIYSDLIAGVQKAAVANIDYRLNSATAKRNKG